MEQDIAIGADHAGFFLKEAIKEHLIRKGFGVKDFGTYSDKPCDYPDYAKLVASSISKKEYPFGILICGTGIGMSISANRFPNVRAGLCPNEEFAELSRKHNDCNILCLPARLLSKKQAYGIVDIFLSTKPDLDERHKRRIDKLG